MIQAFIGITTFALCSFVAFVAGIIWISYKYKPTDDEREQDYLDNYNS